MTHRHLSCVPAAVAVLVLVAGCGSVASSPAASAPPQPSPTVAATPTADSTSGIPRPVVTDPAGVAAAIGGTVVPGGERLLPGYLPSGLAASVSVDPNAYSVTYTDDQHTREISLLVNEGANPPPATAPGRSSTYIQFRGRRASYVVYDATAPLSMRHLSWPDEKGIATGPRGPDYLLSSTGLTETEFFRVANSLQPI